MNRRAGLALLFLAVFPACPPAARAAPPVTAGLVLHLDACAIGGLNDGDKIEQWNDLSGLGNNAAQPDEAKRPTYKTGILSGKPVARFNGINNHLVMGAPASLQITGDISIFSIIHLTADQSSAITTWANDGFSGYPWHFLYHNSSKKLRYNNDAISSVDSDSAVPINQTILAAFEKQGGTVRFYLNGELDGTHTGISDPNPGNTFAAISRSDSQYFHGDIAEILIYNRALPEAEREAVEQYLGHKWLGWPAPPCSGAFIAEFY